MMRRSDKDAVIKEVRECIEKSQAVFLTNLIGITANNTVRIRKQVREAEGRVIVARNTLFRKAAEGTRCEKLLADLKGSSAVTFAFNNPPAVAKVIYDASKEFEIAQIRGGMLEDQVLSAKEVEALAKLPSREQMLGTLLATFNAPISAFARVLNAIREKSEAGA
jgi:large subunit ribosomal protein L10